MSDTSPAYLLVQMTVTDPETYFAEYAVPLLQMFGKIGARVLVAANDPTVLEGQYAQSNTVIVEFPSLAALDDWYESAAYQPLKARRIELSEAGKTLMLRLPAFQMPS